ncbi:MAG: nucleotidyltransferase family protein [Chloroflexota bacterium]
MITAILLAAGEGKRMRMSKPLLQWHGETLIEYQVDQLRRGGCEEVIAVLGHNARSVRPLAERVGATTVVNVEYQKGRSSSLRAGAFALPQETSEAVVINVDQPRPASVIRALLDEHLRSGALITLPTFEGKRGHPAMLCGSIVPELQRVDEATKGLLEIMRRRDKDIHELAFDTDIVLLDLNSPADYEAALARFAN